MLTSIGRQLLTCLGVLGHRRSKYDNRNVIYEWAYDCDNHRHVLSVSSSGVYCQDLVFDWEWGTLL
jgi:hypothetical protein